MSNTMKNTFLLMGFLCFTALNSSGCSWIGIGKPKRPPLSIHVTVRDEEDNLIAGAEVRITEDAPSRGGKKEPKSMTYATLKDGTRHIQTTFSLPLRIHVSHGEAYFSKTVTIHEGFFSEKQKSTTIDVVLPRRKTVISGNVVDMDNDEPIDCATVYVKLFEDLIKTTDKDGKYEIQSADFYEGELLTVSAERTEKSMKRYGMKEQQVTIHNYWGENKVPEIRLKCLTPDSITTDTTQSKQPDLTGKVYDIPKVDKNSEGIQDSVKVKDQSSEED